MLTHSFIYCGLFLSLMLAQLHVIDAQSCNPGYFLAPGSYAIQMNDWDSPAPTECPEWLEINTYQGSKTGAECQAICDADSTCYGYSAYHNGQYATCISCGDSAGDPNNQNAVYLSYSGNYRTYWKQPPSCQACAADTYEANDVCTECPDGSTSPEASDAITDCTCSTPFAGPAGGPCTCAGGYETATVQLYDLQDDSSYCYYHNSMQACTSCTSLDELIPICESLCRDYSWCTGFWTWKDNANGANTYKQCNLCNYAGYFYNSDYKQYFHPGGFGDTCLACAAGKYGQNEVCLNCPANSYSSSSGSDLTECLCNTGFTGPNGGPCNQCASGKYKSITGSAACTDCDPGDVSNSAFTGCDACTAGKYESSNVCLDCPANTDSTSGSVLSGCLCDAGYTGPNGGTCNQCAAGKFKTTTGSAACTDCQAGYESNPAHFTNCLICPHGEYEDASEYCVSCPANTYTSASGSYAITDCQCNAGFAGPNGGTCTQCTVGKYKQALGSAACPDCNAGQTSVSPFTNCVTCAAGKYESDSVCVDCDPYHISSSGSTSCTFGSCPTDKYKSPGETLYATDTFEVQDQQLFSGSPTYIRYSPTCEYYAMANGILKVIHVATNIQTTATSGYVLAMDWRSEYEIIFIHRSGGALKSAVLNPGTGTWTITTLKSSLSSSTSPDAGFSKCVAISPDKTFVLVGYSYGLYRFTFANSAWAHEIGVSNSGRVYANGGKHSAKMYISEGECNMNQDGTGLWIAEHMNRKIRFYDIPSVYLGNGVDLGNSRPMSFAFTPDYNYMLIAVTSPTGLYMRTMDTGLMRNPVITNLRGAYTRLDVCKEDGASVVVADRGGWPLYTRVGSIESNGDTCADCPAETPNSEPGGLSVDVCYNCLAGKVYDNALSSCVSCEAGKYTQEALEFDVSGWCTTNSYADKNLNGHYVQDGYCYGTPRYSMTDEYGNKWYMFLNQDPDNLPSNLRLVINPRDDCSSNENHAFIQVQSNDVATYGFDLSKFNPDYSPYWNMNSDAATREWWIYCSTGWEIADYATPMLLSNVVRTPMNDATSCVSCGVGKYSSSTGATSSLTCQSCVFPSFQNNAGASTCSTTTCATNDYLKSTTNILQVALTWAAENYLTYIGVYTLHTETCDGKPVYKHPKSVYLWHIAQWNQWAIGSTICSTSRSILFESTPEPVTKSYDGSSGNVAKMWLSSAWTQRAIDMEVYRSEETAACEDCPAETPLSPAGSTSVDACFNGCDPGQAFDTNGNCQDCEAGKYQTSSAYTGDCLDCPANSDTVGVTAATALTACKCDLGYAGNDGGPCTACSTGQYKAVVGSAACLSCIANDPNSVAALDSASTFCECDAGYVLLSNVCTECIKGTYKEMQGNETDYITANCELVDGCCACGHNKTTLSTATVTADPSGGGCICQTGYGYGNDACLACALGSYKDVENVQECTNCDLGGTTELIKSTTEEACISDIGYYTLDATESATLGVDFAECLQDTYASETNLLECYDCPIGSTTQTLTTRTSVNDCICTETGYVSGGAHCTCSAGYYRAASGNCELCEEDTYCIGAREDISGTCPDNSVSNIGSTQLQDCKCNIGFSGPDGGPCTQCEDHTFKANTGPEACTPCPDNSQSPSGSTSLVNCVCNAGFSGPDGGACSQCEVGTYKNVIGSSACASCGVAETSPAASTSESACICIAGYYLVSDTCTACVTGTYQENLAATACENCPSGSSTANDATASIDDCLCMPGYYANFVDGNLAGCEQCADASYKTTLANTDCNSCPANAQSPLESDSITDCTCNAGYSGNNGSPCIACQESTFKSTSGPEACDTCDPNAYSLSASILQTACQCNAGYTGNDGDVCIACEAGKYKTTIGATVCSPCPLNSYSNAASTLLQECLCNAGYTGANGAQCSTCSVGTYKSIAGDSECINCAENEISPQASTDISACECNVGHGFNVDTNSCEECIPGKFKNSIGDIDCSLCPLHSNSISGATQITQCICNAGYEGVHGDTCVLCAAGKYENEAHVCVDCPDNSDSESGSSSVFDCKCDAGFTGSHGGPCSACATGTYKTNIGSAICSPCNVHATTLQDASTLATDCLCEAAYTLIDSTCTICADNTFKPDISNAACTNCQEFAVSPAGSSQASDCTCIDQYFDAGDGSCDRACGLGFEASLNEQKCVGCQESYYKDFTGIDSCVACPNNAFSRKRNSTLIYSCLCYPGYFWQDNSCVICGAGKFSNLENVTACFDCVQAANADPPTNIVCPNLIQVPAGYELNQAQNGIQICPNNTFNDGSLLTCSMCPSPETFKNEAGLTSVVQCECNPGYYRNAEQVCVACSLGTFKTQVGDDACTLCPADANTAQEASTSLSECLCTANFELSDTATLQSPSCVACESTAVKHTLSNTDMCVLCQSHSTLLVGSVHDANACKCDPGHAAHVTNGDGTANSPCLSCNLPNYDGRSLYMYAGISTTITTYQNHFFQITTDGNHVSNGGTALPGQAVQPGPPPITTVTISTSLACQEIYYWCGQHSGMTGGKIFVMPSDGSSCAGNSFKAPKTCQACINGKFKATFSDTACVSCGAQTNTEPSAAAISKTQCVCKDTYEASASGPPSLVGGSCVRSCGFGKFGQAGVCNDCPRGKWKSNFGSSCESCTFPRTASAIGTKSNKKCSCPKRNFGIKATDLITVSSLGNYVEETAQIYSATLDATQTYFLAHASKKFWKLQLDGVYQTVLVTVDNNKVFTCESHEFAVATSFCSNLNIDLQKIRGSLQLFAKRFDSEENILPNNVELYVFTQREVTFENVEPWVTTSIQDKAKSYAANGNLQLGTALFKNKRVFDKSTCAPCPRNLICKDP
jgi:hypothetical protein